MCRGWQSAGMDTPDNRPETPSKSPSDGAPDGPLLDLSTLIERPVIRIDGVTYEILSPDEISIIDGHRLGMWGRRINVLAESDQTEGEAELEQLIDKVARKVAVGVPGAVYNALPGAHKQAIADVFTGLLLRKRLGVAGAIAKAAGVLPDGTEISAIGASLFPASSASSEATRDGGWLKRLSRWFARSL